MRVHHPNWQHHLITKVLLWKFIDFLLQWLCWRPCLWSPCAPRSPHLFSSSTPNTEYAPHFSTWSERIVTWSAQEPILAAGVKSIVCVEEIKMGVLAHSSVCPGFSTYICNLLRSYAPRPNPKYPPWLQEYRKYFLYKYHHRYHHSSPSPSLSSPSKTRWH